MKLVSMKLSKAEAKKETGPIEMTPPKYPFGLELRLDNDALEKLGIDDPEVGSEVRIEAKATVTAYRESERQGRARDCSAELQITELGIEEAPDKRRERKTSQRLDKLA